MARRILYLVVNIFLVFRLSFQESCNTPLGLEDRSIPDENLYASSQINSWHGAQHARLNNDKGATVWCAQQRAIGEYIQVDLGKNLVLNGVATQGRNKTKYHQYIEAYYIAYGSDGKNFSNLTDDQGNTVVFFGHNEASINYLPSIVARYFRLYVLAWKRNVCTQLELYGCPAKYCSVNNGGCSEKCTQIVDGQVKCGCHKAGHKLVDGVCQDIDECAESTKPCAHYCDNTIGSYKCSCKSGYTLRDNHWCEDINECRGNHTCDQICHNVPGTYTCRCRKGYEFGPDKVKCIDVDECARKTSGCQHNCTNTIGSFQCSCRKGYKLQRDGKSCVDIDECHLETHKCDQICLNNEGGYSCKCRQGYVLASDGLGCDDINECEKNNGGCSDTCINNQGSYICTCPKGFRLKLDERNCEDVDECQRNNGNCKHICTNEVGSYKCSCYAGYKLKSDGYSCEDINECSVVPSPCDLSSTVCTNTRPQYRCDCKQGFERKPGSSVSCQRVKCGAFSVDPKFTVSPPRCLLSDTNVYGDTCTFKCAAGYEPVDPQNMRSTCLANRQWSMTFPRCIGVKCPAIPAPSNGKVSPPQCAYGIRYPGTCNIRCDSGYNNVGPSSVSCQTTGSFGSNVASLGCQKDKIKPSISCPPGIVAELPEGSKSMIVAAQWKDAYSNVGKITSSHDLTFEFPAGVTEVTFTAATDDGESDSCTMRVTILDKEAPKALYCPEDQVVRKTTGTLVEWPEPNFTDNVGVHEVTSSMKPGIDLSPNDYLIVYTAKDHAGNVATCKFYVNVTQKTCSPKDFTVDAATTEKQCTTAFGASYCAVNCKQGRVFLTNPVSSWYTCFADGIWTPLPNTVPQCAGYSKFVDQCPEGTFELSNPSGLAESKVCANCPAGTFYNKGGCVKCSVGTYQDEEKQLSCKKCPARQGTSDVGAKECQYLCSPGKYSASGISSADKPCKMCRIGEYQENYGSKSCMKCPRNTTTKLLGSKLKDDCGRAGYIKMSPRGQITVTEGEDVEFVCHTSAYPSFSIAWKRVGSNFGFGGKVTQKHLYDNDKLSGMSYSISQVTYYDRGVYMCETKNNFGVVQQCLTLNVLKNI